LQIQDFGLIFFADPLEARNQFHLPNKPQASHQTVGSGVWPSRLKGIPTNGGFSGEPSQPLPSFKQGGQHEDQHNMKSSSNSAGGCGSGEYLFFFLIFVTALIR